MDRRITFFVARAERTDVGWLVHGESGLGPPEVGDIFRFIQHPAGAGEDRAAVRIAAVEPGVIRLLTDDPIDLGEGDILVGATDL